MGEQPSTKPPVLKQELLQQLPSITELLKSSQAADWLNEQSPALVSDCLRHAVANARQQVLSSQSPQTLPEITEEQILSEAARLLRKASTPRIRAAINATGIILHTGLGRAVFSGPLLAEIARELDGYCTLAMDVTTGERAERDELVQYIFQELTGAEAATVVNNNAAATMLVLAALAAQREVIVSRGQLIEIGGSFRLPEVMAQSQARLVEVGATNRTHIKDYRNAITPDTAAIMRVHPSNYRVVGFTSEVPLAELAELAHSKDLILIDDLGAGALVGLERFGLEHEPTIQESLAAGADIVLFSGDKLIGGSQAGIVVGRKDLIARLRKHPLMRAMRADKTCLMILERTLRLFRHPAQLAASNPTFGMLSTPVDVLRRRAEHLVHAISVAAPSCKSLIQETVAYLGSGSLPTEALPSIGVTVISPGVGASELARRLREDDACIFCRIEKERVLLDMRTVTDAQVSMIAAAFARLTHPNGSAS